MADRDYHKKPIKYGGSQESYGARRRREGLSPMSPPEGNSELSSSYGTLTGDEPEGRVVLPEELERKKGKDLGDILPSIIAIAGFGVGIFFLSNNITGNAIANLTTKTSSFLGAGLLIVGLVAGFFWINGKKNSKKKVKKK